MTDLINPKAVHHLPSFITVPGDADVLMVVTGIFLLCAVIGFGILFLRLHALPEHIAHGSHKVQLELVSVLCLIALFTHMHIFWIAGLILAFIELPDFGHPLRRIAGSVEKIAGVTPGEGAVEVPSGAPDAHDAQHDGALLAPLDAPSATKPATAVMAQKELSHA
jgi:hypothetical protein